MTTGEGANTSPMPVSDLVRCEVDGHVAILTIDRPEARNAINVAVSRALVSLLEWAESEPEIFVLVLTGTPPVFCAGADLKELRSGSDAELDAATVAFAEVVRRPGRKPLVAAVEGAALAAGAEIVMSCDLVVAGASARIGIPEVRRGLVAAAGGLFRLGRRIPLNLAMEAALTGDPIDAATAHRFGLVNELCPDGEARGRAVALAGRIAANAPIAVRESRAILLDCTFADDAEGWRRSSAAAASVLGSEDVAEGVAAFLEKRSPEWKGR